MNSAEKANELARLFVTRRQALICVDEILKQFVGLHKPEYTAFDCIVKPRQFTFEGEYETHMTGYDMVAYWEEVKKEIEKMEQWKI